MNLIDQEFFDLQEALRAHADATRQKYKDLTKAAIREYLERHPAS